MNEPHWNHEEKWLESLFEGSAGRADGKLGPQWVAVTVGRRVFISQILHRAGNA